jgi:hypothetical protein
MDFAIVSSNFVMAEMLAFFEDCVCIEWSVSFGAAVLYFDERYK